jgi:hypothetical protein
VSHAYKKTVLHKKNLDNIYYQFVKFPTLTPLAKVIKEEASNPSSQALNEDSESQGKRLTNIMNQMVASEAQRRHVGDGLIMKREDLAIVSEWVLDDIKEKNWSKNPISLEDITLVLFRTNTKDHQWLVQSDQQRFSKEDVNTLYSFTTDVAITFSVFPFYMSCCKKFVSTKGTNKLT